MNNLTSRNIYFTRVNILNWGSYLWHLYFFLKRKLFNRETSRFHTIISRNISRFHTVINRKISRFHTVINRKISRFHTVFNRKISRFHTVLLSSLASLHHIWYCFVMITYIYRVVFYNLRVITYRQCDCTWFIKCCFLAACNVLGPWMIAKLALI